MVPNDIIDLGHKILEPKYLQDKIDALEKENRKLEAQILELKARILELEAENQTLKAELQGFKDNPLTLDDTGIYLDKNGRPFCPVCSHISLSTSQIPLQKNNAKGNWTQFCCPKCKEVFENGPRPISQSEPWSIMDNW